MNSSRKEEERQINRRLIDLAHEMTALGVCPDGGPERYRPSSAGEGDFFYWMWCSHCERDAAHRADPDRDDGCEILLLSYALDIEDPEYPPELGLVNNRPVCAAFVPEGEPLPPAVAPGQLGLFEEKPQ